MTLHKVDLNLFVVFDAIYTESSLTRAGQNIGITQPAVSNALARLRETFNDPLFLRTAHGMIPTPMARRIVGPIRNALSLLQVSVQQSRGFDPLLSNRTLRISMNDLSEVLLLPRLLQRLQQLAPDLCIESFGSRHHEIPQALAAGHLDLAIDAPAPGDAQIHHLKLLEDRYVCAMRKQHPLAQHDTLELEQYLAQPQILVAHPRDKPHSIDLALARLGRQRRIALRSRNHLMAWHALQQTDLIMTVPEHFARQHALHWVNLPVEQPALLETHLYWHESTDHDPANRWMREQLIELCLAMGLEQPS
ncbi:LysR family transcriptional regulator [Pseudomonas sp. 21LCFQ010]|uniref:LysR family transcriptional regulator n=1 Tax=Pseudomonas sp. 21LCFQ010 TaxID=2957506 RepID=UPI002096FC3C|nr:LysR family transcriptional regulator [Pseudomonas sp. 21LCFQ010]MCO8161939.1 LysR family transcriptional regulator [Pseudomonas sp. 21LCFQ010]